MAVRSRTVKLERTARRPGALMVPRPLGAGASGRFEVDATWGTVQPHTLAPGVRTVGELEVLAHVGQGRPLVDTRLRHFFEQGTIPTARNIPHDQIVDRIDELDPSQPAILFCNGPQCAATPQAVHALLAAGYPPRSLRYYRGGMHDWITLGYPVTRADVT